MLTNYLKISWRNLTKHKAFSFINILGLAAGLSCCLLISLYVYDELSYDTQHRDVSQIYQIGTVFVRPSGENKTAATPYPVADALKQEYPEISSTTRLVGLFAEDKTLLRSDGPTNQQQVFYETDGYLADPTFFSFFTYDFLEGRGESALAAPNTIVLSEEIARKLFGNQPALNRTVHVESNTNGENEYRVTGVFRPGNVPSHINARFFLSFAGGGLSQYVKSQTGMAGNNMFFTYLKLKPGTDARKLEAKLPGFVEKYMRKDLVTAGFDKRQFLTAITDIHLRTDLTHNVTPNGSLTYLYILLSVGVFTLLIACINFMNLSTARSAKRSGEVGVRKALGAGQGSLIRQFLSESFLFSFFAFLLALGFTWLLIPAFEQVSGKTVHFSPVQLLLILGSFFALSLLTGLLAGSYPAFYLSSFRPLQALKGREGSGRQTGKLAVVSLRRGLVVFQFTLSVMLIVASLVIGQQMTFLRSTDLGFSKDQQLVIPLRSSTAKASYTALKNALASNARIASVGASAYYPGIFNPEDASFYGEEQTVQQGERTRTNRIDVDYLNTLALRPVAGRLFSRAYPADTSNIIINEQAVRKLGYASAQAAIGQKAYTDRSGTREGFTIVGVVKDFHFEDLHLPITPYAFTLNDGTYNYVVAHVKAGDMQGVIQSVEASWRQTVPGEPFAYSFLDEEFQKNYVAETRLATVVGYFTFIAILISCLGLFGLASFNVEQRTKEIGIRKVLGATVGNVVLLLSRDFLKLVLVAIVLASPLAWYVMHRWLENFAYQIQISWPVFLLTAFLALLVASLTVSFQSIRAALMNPVKSLKSE